MEWKFPSVPGLGIDLKQCGSGRGRTVPIRAEWDEDAPRSLLSIGEYGRNRSPSDRQHNLTRAVGSVEEFDWVSLKIEADGAIGAVVDDEPHRSAEGRETTAPSCELLTKAVERLLYKRDGGCRQVEVDAQEYVDADERGDKERLGTGFFR